MTEQTTPRTARCRGCHQPIIWALTEKGKRMPLDAEPSEAGDYILGPALVPGGDPVAIRDAECQYDDKPHHLNHWASCPERDRFRTKKER